MIPIFVGYDPRESIAYHVFCQSILSRTSRPVAFTPLTLGSLNYFETHTDGSNEFIYSRFLVPYLMGFKGFAIFADGDMVCNSDIANLWALRDVNKAVQVVKHDYKTKHPVKYLGAKNDDYPCKNWSSLILWNCGHVANSILTPRYIEGASGKMLHRFEHLRPDEIGELPLSWNYLVGEYGLADADLYHYTIGTPCFREYDNCDHADRWHEEHAKVNQCLQ